MYILYTHDTVFGDLWPSCFSNASIYKRKTKSHTHQVYMKSTIVWLFMFGDPEHDHALEDCNL